MKKIVIALSLALCALMLLACGPAAEVPQTPAPTKTPEAAATQKPVMDIDDSLSFRGQMGETNEPFKAAYTEKMAQHVNNIEVLEVKLFCNLGYDYPLWSYGCFTFTGTPKPELGWEQQDVYCRSFNICTEDGENWSFAKSYPMEPCETLKSFIYGDDWSIKDCDTTVSGLTSAELYVSQLGESYTVTESAALRKLEAALSQMRYGEWNSGSGAPEIECGFVNPLYLRYADGSTKLVLTVGDGSNACYIWDGWYVYNDGESIFERFGVPLEAAGYGREDGLTRTKYSFEYKDAPV